MEFVRCIALGMNAVLMLGHAIEDTVGGGWSSHDILVLGPPGFPGS